MNCEAILANKSLLNKTRLFIRFWNLSITEYDNQIYYYRISEHNDGFDTWYTCKLYERFLCFPMEIYKKVFIKQLGGNSKSKMGFETAFDYEYNELKD